MKPNFVRALLAVALLSCGFALPAPAQNTSGNKKSSSTAAAGINVSTSNGRTTITYQGKEVWSGRTTGQVTARAKSVDGVDYAAAFDGGKVIWQNVAGASTHLK